MKSVSGPIVIAALAVTGVILFGSNTVSLHRSGKLASDQNPMAIHRSAYGKLLARLSESTIDRVWHMGVEQVTPHGVEGCGHDHAPGETCNHGESAETFTFHVDDKGNIEEESDHEDHSGHDHAVHAEHDHADHSVHDHGAHAEHDHADHSDHDHGDLAKHDHADHSDHDHGDHAEHDHADHSDHDHGDHSDHEHAAPHSETCDRDHAAGESCNHNHAHTAAPGDNQFKLLGSTPKEWLQNASIVRYKRTNPKSLSDRHLAEIKMDVEQMLLRSYKMDPTHYGAYNSYHLFLTAHDFGGTEHTRKHAKVIAEHTLQVISQEKEDPEAWLTAAAAALNIYFLESEDATATGTQLSAETLKNHRNRIAYCLNQFASLQDQALKNGNWDGVPIKRQLEIESRSRFALKTFEQFDAMIARAEARSSEKAEGTVVGGIEIP